MSEANPENPVLSLVLNVDEINHMLGLIGEQPYNKSAGIISLIMRQVQPQIEKFQAERAAAEEQPEGQE